jgi:cobyrinic acid a,c-diamide synthase
LADTAGIVIAAPSSGAGKTLVTLGLIGAMRASGRRVASAKAGPDYIDPRFHEAASGRASINLDPWAMRPDHARRLARQHARDADILIVEGAMGLFDGPEAGGGSTADLAALLGLPAILVIDAASQAQSAAALVQGFAFHRADCRIAGIILNRVASDRHERLLRTAIAATGIPVLGAVPRTTAVSVPSRHLGLVQAGEHPDLAALRRGCHHAPRRGRGSRRIVQGAAAPLAGAGTPDRCRRSANGSRLRATRPFAFAYPHLLDGWRWPAPRSFRSRPSPTRLPTQPPTRSICPAAIPNCMAGAVCGTRRFMSALRRAARAARSSTASAAATWSSARR